MNGILRHVRPLQVCYCNKDANQQEWPLQAAPASAEDAWRGSEMVETTNNWAKSLSQEPQMDHPLRLEALAPADPVCSLSRLDLIGDLVVGRPRSPANARRGATNDVGFKTMAGL